MPTWRARARALLLASWPSLRRRRCPATNELLKRIQRPTGSRFFGHACLRGAAWLAGRVGDELAERRLRAASSRGALSSAGTNSTHVASAKPRSAHAQAEDASLSETSVPIRSSRGSRFPRMSSPCRTVVPVRRRNGISKRVSGPVIGRSVVGYLSPQGF